MSILAERWNAIPSYLHQSETDQSSTGLANSYLEFETWIFGSPLKLITDHNPLTFIIKNALQSSKLQRWTLALQKYDITVSHCSGAKLTNADALSRLDTIE